MTTLSEAVYNIINVLRGGQVSGGETISPEQVKYTIQYYRALLIRRDDSERTFEFEQDLGLIPVEVVPANEVSINLQGGLLMRTDELPTPIRLRDKLGITSVYAPDRQTLLPLVDFQAVRFQAYNKYTSLVMRSFYLNNRVYAFASPLLLKMGAAILDPLAYDSITEQDILEHQCFVVVRGVFENPIEAWEYANPGETWDDDTSPYPLPGDMEQRIVQSLLSGEFKMMAQTPFDSEADNLPTNAA